MTSKQEVSISNLLDMKVPLDWKEVVQARTSEAKNKAVETLRSDRMLIESLNSPNLNGRHPIEIFPIELWVAIFSHLDDARDLQNISDTCPLFEDLLEKRRVTDILMPASHEVRRFRESLENMETVWILFNLKVPTYLVTLRSVCKSWRNMVDKWITKEVETSSRCGEEHAKGFPTLLLEYPVLPGQERLQFLLERNFDPETKNCAQRFFFKAIKVRSPNFFLTHPIFHNQRMNNDHEEFCSFFTKILGYIGDQVLSFSFTLHWVENLLEVYNLLVGWVKLMPNLKYLEIKLMGQGHLVNSRRPITNLNQEFQNNPFPRLKKLESLVLSSHSLIDQFRPVLEKILRQNSHVTSLSMDSDYGLLHGNIPEIVKSLELESISVKLSPKMSFIQSQPRSRYMSRFLNPSWNLKKIKLEFENCDLVMSKVFQLLQQFQTLENVALNLANVRIIEESNLFLKLPKLTHFRFHLNFQRHGKLPKFLFSLNPLIPCGNLKKIVWTWHKLQRTWGAHLRYRRNLIPEIMMEKILENNLQQIFPRLESIIIKDEV